MGALQDLWASEMVSVTARFFLQKMLFASACSTVINLRAFSLIFPSASRRAAVQPTESHGRDLFNKTICLHLTFGKINEFDFWTVSSLSLKYSLDTMGKQHTPLSPH
jgi:hypothetical protein